MQQQQLHPSFTANQFPPDEQFEVQTEPPVLPDTSTHYSEEPPASDLQYAAPIDDEEQQQPEQQQFYQQESEASFLHQQQLLQQQQRQQQLQQQQEEQQQQLLRQQQLQQEQQRQQQLLQQQQQEQQQQLLRQQQLQQEQQRQQQLLQQQQQEQQQQESEDEDEEDDSQSSRSENESNAEENNYDQNDDISNEPAESQHDVSEAVEAMETEQTDTVEEFANQNITESDTNHGQSEPTEDEQITEAKLTESNEPMIDDHADDESKNGNEAEATKRSPSQDKAKEEAVSSEKDAEKQESRKRRRSRSKSKSPPAKRANRRASPARNIDDFTNEEDEPEFDENAVLLSWYDSDLNLAINKPDLCSARPLSDGALALAWAGARSTYGVNSGKVCYEVQVNEINRIQNLSDERNLYELRCGWSILSDNLQLGESPLSFGYSGCAKKANESVFSDYGIKYGSRGDVVGVYLDLDSTPCTISYTVNGEPQGTAFEFNKEDLNGASLYPHILTKNLAFTVNFGQNPKLLVNEERPNRARRDESSRRDKDKDKRSKDSTKSSSPASERKRSESESQKPDDVKSEKDDEKSEIKKEEPEAESEQQPEQEAEQEPTEEKVKQENPDDESIEEEKPTVSENGDSNEAKNGEKDKPNESQQKEYSLLPGYELIGTVGNENLVQGYQRPKTRKECEVILLIGLPGAGKTHWATQHSKENVEKHYNILGVQNLLNKMTVSDASLTPDQRFPFSYSISNQIQIAASNENRWIRY